MDGAHLRHALPKTVAIRGKLATKGLSEKLVRRSHTSLTAGREAAECPPMPWPANDRIHIATCLVHGVGAILSADRAFDGQSRVRRLDPLDEGTISALG